MEETRTRVLVVEDNEDTADCLRELIAEVGHDVQVALTGQDAIRIAADWKPHVVFLDLGLPDIDGFEVARSIRSGASSHSMLVALTGYGRDHDAERSKQAGFAHHLVKPPETDDLFRIIDEVVHVKTA